jgi:hypothetical protein
MRMGYAQSNGSGWWLTTLTLLIIAALLAVLPGVDYPGVFLPRRRSA